jgi:hypothetical protein
VYKTSKHFLKNLKNIQNRLIRTQRWLVRLRLGCRGEGVASAGHRIRGAAGINHRDRRVQNTAYLLFAGKNVSFT